MGLGFFGSKARWSRDGFHGFRSKLAFEVGIDIKLMEGFGGTGRWEDLNDPIVDLLFRADCSGRFTPEQCRNIAPRVRDLVKNWNDNDYDKQQAILLADGMEQCAENCRYLEFC